MADADNSISQWWVRTANSGKVFGPVGQEGLLDWARQCRVFPDDQISNNQQQWRPAREAPFLGMDTIIVHADGRMIGPFHPDAVDVLRSTGKIPEDSKVVSTKAILDGAGGGAGSDPSPELLEAQSRCAELEHQLKTAKSARKDMAEQLEAARAVLEEREAAAGGSDEETAHLRANVDELTVRNSELQGQVESLTARIGELETGKGALEEKCGDFESRNASLAKQVEELSAKAESVDTEAAAARQEETERFRAEAEGLAARNSELQGQVESLTARIGELEAGKGALEEKCGDFESRNASLAKQVEDLTAKAGAAAAEAAAAGQAEMELLRANIDGLSTQNGDLQSHVESLEAKVAELEAAASGHAEEVGSLKARAEELLRQLDESAEAASARDKADAERAVRFEELQAEADSLRTEMARAKEASAEARAEVDRVKGELESARADYETLRIENAELLEFSNTRDGESRRRIMDLETQLSQIGVRPDEMEVIPSDLVGDARQVKLLQEKVTDLTRERCELSEKLATAEAELSVRKRPADADAVLLRQFADEALAELKATYEREKAENDAARTASVARQQQLHESVQRLERALCRDPGEKTRSELQEERNEKTIAKLRQELDSAREQHKADLGRAAQTEKVLEGPVKALQQREGALREQLRRVEQHTADYDSLSSQVHRRETELLEAEKQFAAAREQWQAVESMLNRRIQELEHGAGSLFEQVDANAEETPKFTLPDWVHNMK